MLTAGTGYSFCLSERKWSGSNSRCSCSQSSSSHMTQVGRRWISYLEWFFLASVGVTYLLIPNLKATRLCCTFLTNLHRHPYKSLLILIFTQIHAKCPTDKLKFKSFIVHFIIIFIWLPLNRWYLFSKQILKNFNHITLLSILIFPAASRSRFFSLYPEPIVSFFNG